MALNNTLNTLIPNFSLNQETLTALTLNQLSQIAWNILFGLMILMVIYYVLKKWIKRFMIEALREYEKDKNIKDMMSRVQHVRNKYGVIEPNETKV